MDEQDPDGGRQELSHWLSEVTGNDFMTTVNDIAHPWPDSTVRLVTQ